MINTTVRVALLAFMVVVGCSGAQASDEAEITILCGGAAKNAALDQERMSAPLNPAEVTIRLGQDSVTLASVAPSLLISTRRYLTLQWDPLLIVFQSNNAIGFVQRQTGEVTITAKIDENPGPVLFQLRCEAVKTKF